MLCEHRGEGVDAPADRLDAVQVRLHDLEGRDPATGDATRQLSRIQPDQIRDVHLPDAIAVPQLFHAHRKSTTASSPGTVRDCLEVH